MNTRENVTKAMEFCLTPYDRREHDDADVCPHTDCSYFRAYDMGNCVRALCSDALALLKAQEPKLVTNIHKEHNNVLNPNVPWVGKCPKCGKKVEGRNLTRFCKFCGQAVKWE